MIGKLLGNLAPTITFQSAQAKVESIDFRLNEAEICVRIADGRLLAFTIPVPSVRVKESP